MEELAWRQKTEQVKIFRRFLVHKFSRTEDKKNKFLNLTLKIVDLNKERQEQEKIIGRIIEKHYTEMAYSYAGSLTSALSIKLLYDIYKNKEIQKIVADNIARSKKMQRGVIYGSNKSNKGSKGKTKENPGKAKTTGKRN